jgi:hypothetical protein
VTLLTLIQKGLVRGLPSHLINGNPRIAASSPTARAALGYLHVEGVTPLAVNSVTSTSGVWSSPFHYSTDHPGVVEIEVRHKAAAKAVKIGPLPEKQ